MRAEANAEISSDPSAANNDINILRNRVEMGEIDYSSLTMASFRKNYLKNELLSFTWKVIDFLI